MGFVQSPQADSDWRGVLDPGKIASVGMWEREIAQAPQQSSLQFLLAQSVLTRIYSSTSHCPSLGAQSDWLQRKFCSLAL